MQVLVLLVKKDIVGLRQSMEGLQHGVERLGAFCAVENQGLLGGFDELRLPGFENTRSARVFGFPIWWSIRMGWQLRLIAVTYTSLNML